MYQEAKDLHGTNVKAAEAMEIGETTFRRRLREEIESQVVTDPTQEAGRAHLREEAEIRQLRTENRRLTREVLDQRTLLEDVAARVSRELTPPLFDFTTRSLGRKKRDVLLHISDVHYGERVVESDVAGGVNVFGSDAVRLRAARYVDAVANSMADYAEGHTLENLVIALGGDICTGDEIFGEQAWQLDRNPVEQVLEVVDILTGVVHSLMETAASLEMKGVSIFAVPGNHGRVGGRRRAGRPTTYSWDYMAYEVMKRDLAQYPLSQFQIESAGTCYFKSQGHTFQLAHGDEVRGALSIPFYGVGRYDQRSIRSHQIVPDYLLLGHHHQEARIPLGYGRSLHSGAWMGANNLSREVGQGYASQNMFLVSEEFGAAQYVEIHLQSLEERRQAMEVYTV